MPVTTVVPVEHRSRINGKTKEEENETITILTDYDGSPGGRALAVDLLRLRVLRLAAAPKITREINGLDQGYFLAAAIQRKIGKIGLLS